MPWTWVVGEVNLGWGGHGGVWGHMVNMWNYFYSLIVLNASS